LSAAPNVSVKGFWRTLAGRTNGSPFRRSPYQANVRVDDSDKGGALFYTAAVCGNYVLKIRARLQGRG